MELENREIVARSREALKDKWGVAMGGTVLVYAAMIGISFIPVLNLLSFVITGPLLVGLYAFYLRIVRSQKPQATEVFSGFSNFLNAMLTYLLMLLFVFLWSLLLIVPGIIAAFSYSMAPYLIADNPDMTAMQAIRESKAMMQGRKWKLFCLGLRYIGWFLLGVVTLGIAFLWVLPMVSAAGALFYDDLKANRATSAPNADDPAPAA